MNTQQKKPTEARRDRPIFGQKRDKLAVVFKDPEFHKKWYPRWINDDGVLIPNALESGYEFVEKDEIVSTGSRDTANVEGNVDSHVSIVTGRSGMKAFLMKIDRDLYDIEVAENSRRANEKVDSAIKGDFSGKYAPRTTPTRITKSR